MNRRDWTYERLPRPNGGGFKDRWTAKGFGQIQQIVFTSGSKERGFTFEGKTGYVATRFDDTTPAWGGEMSEPFENKREAEQWLEEADCD